MYKFYNKINFVYLAGHANTHITNLLNYFHDEVTWSIIGTFTLFSRKRKKTLYVLNFR